MRLQAVDIKGGGGGGVWGLGGGGAPEATAVLLMTRHLEI